MDEDKQQLLSLQDSLTGCRGEQCLDIGDIWRYLHRERDAEWLTESQDTPLSISADSLREKVIKEIKTLKTQLVRNEAALQALEGHALPAALGRAGYKYKTVGDSLLGTLSLGDLCNEAVSGPSKLDSTSCPHLGEKHNIGLTQTETKTRTSCLVQKRRAPHVKNSKYALLNSSTGSSTSGVDVSSISSRSDSQHKSVCILETPIDCPSSPDSDNPLVRQRSQSFRLAIERGASIDSSLPSCDTSPDLSPVSYTEYVNKDKNQHLATIISKQVINSGAREHGDKTDKSDQSNNCPDTTRTQKSRTKQELNSNNTDFKVEMDMKNKEIGLILGTDENDSPHSRRLSTLVEESDQETEEFHLVHLHSPRSPNSPSYLRGSSKKHRTQSLPRYKEPPSYKDIMHNQSRASPQSDDNRFGHHRSRSLSPDHHYLRTASPGYHSDVLVSTSLPASPQIIAQSKSHQAKLEFKPSASGQSSTTTSKISEKETRVVGSKGSDNHNVIVKKDGELNNNVTTSKNQRSGDVKVRRKSLHDMRQSSCNVVLINKTEDGITEKMEETLHARPVQDTSNTVVTNNESSKSNRNLTENTNTCEKRKQNESRDKPSLDICQTTATLSHNKDNSSSDAQTVKDNLAKRRQLQKQPTTMPDLTEVCGGERCEHDSNTSLIVKSGKNEEVKAAFPSLSDVFLEKMKLFPGRKDKVKTSIDQTPEQEIEEKFVRLSLAFKTDKLTLDKRVELHQRARDVAEQNIEEQLASVKEALKVLGPLCKDAKTREVFSKIEHHVDVLGSSTARMSSRAEILGAVKQEYRISEAIDVMIQHVENLKQSLEREHAELEEAKRMLMESRHVVEADAILHRKSLSITSHGSKEDASCAQGTSLGNARIIRRSRIYHGRSTTGQRSSSTENTSAATNRDQEH